MTDKYSVKVTNEAGTEGIGPVAVDADSASEARTQFMIREALSEEVLSENGLTEWDISPIIPV